LESRSPVRGRRDARVEHWRRARYPAAFSKLGELGARGRLGAVGRAIEDASPPDDPGADLALQCLESSKESVDRASRRVLLRRVDADREKAIVTPRASAMERRTVGTPLRQELVDRGKERIGGCAVERRIA